MDISKFIEFRLGSVSHRSREWLRKNAVRIAKETFGQEFITQADMKGMSDRYKDSIKFHLAGKNTPNSNLAIQFEVKDYKTEDGKPLWAYFEFGTRSHDIFPKKKQALRWEAGIDQTKTTTQVFAGGTAGESVYLFSKHNYVSGIKARKVLYFTEKYGTRKFKNKLVNELQRFLEQSASKVGV
jgi:hypothetical protein